MCAVFPTLLIHTECIIFLLYLAECKLWDLCYLTCLFCVLRYPQSVFYP
jgi:hypothetical protein